MYSWGLRGLRRPGVEPLAAGGCFGLAVAATLLAGFADPPLRSLFNAADPDAEAIGGQLWIFPTGSPSDRLVAWASADLVKWRQRGVLIRQGDIGWIKADGARVHYLWAPDMVAGAGGRWFLYYSVGPQNPTPSRIGVAACAGPAGPCVDSGRPLLTGGKDAAGAEFEAIDPMVFRDPKSGVAFLYAGGSAGARLRAFVLKPDMVTIDREVAVAQPPLFTEGVFVHERRGTYHLSYSSGNWQGASYSVHHATGPSPVGPWTYRGPILTSDRRFKGPGHHSFVADPTTGVPLIVYHRWEGQQGAGPYKGLRRVAIAAIEYAADGAILPVAMNPAREAMRP